MRYLLLLLSLFFFTLSTVFAECKFINEKRPVLSLSGPVTHYLYHLGLLNKVKAIGQSQIKNFKGDRIGGGLFLSGKSLLQYGKNSLVFLDKSQELRKNLSNIHQETPDLDFVEIDTLKLSPFEAYRKVKSQVLPYLNEIQCQQQIRSLDLFVEKVEKSVFERKAFTGTYLFYMGPVIKQEAFPYLLILNDGPPGLLLKQKKIKSYPAPEQSAYVPWSQKEMKRIKTSLKDYPRPIVHVGLPGVAKTKDETQVDSFTVSKETLSSSLGQNEEIIINFWGASSLIPGLSQVFLLQEMIKVFP